MSSHIFLVCQLLLVAAVSNEEPSACLLQRRTTPLEQVLIQHERIRKPDKDEEEAAANVNNANNAEGKEDEQSSSEGSKEKKEEATEEGEKEEKDSKGTKVKDLDKDEEENDEGENDEKDIKGKKDKKSGKDEEDNEEDEKKDKNTQKGDISEEKKGTNGHTNSESLRLELRLHTSIHDLKDSMGPLTDFMGTLQKALAKAAGITTDRLDVLGVRGEYESDEGATSFFEKDLKASLAEGPVLVEVTSGGKSIVDLEVLPATEKSDLAPHDVFSTLKEELGRKDGPLMKGLLKDVLQGAKLKERGGVDGFEPHHSGTRRNEHRLSCLASLALLSLRFFQ